MELIIIERVLQCKVLLNVNASRRQSNSGISWDFVSERKFCFVLSSATQVAQTTLKFRAFTKNKFTHSKWLSNEFHHEHESYEIGNACVTWCVSRYLSDLMVTSNYVIDYKAPHDTQDYLWIDFNECPPLTPCNVSSPFSTIACSIINVIVICNFRNCRCIKVLW